MAHRRERGPGDRPDPPPVDALLVAAVVGIIVIGIIAIVDIATDGELNPSILALVVSIGSLIPALIVRNRDR